MMLQTLKPSIIVGTLCFKRTSRHKNVLKLVRINASVRIMILNVAFCCYDCRRGRKEQDFVEECSYFNSVEVINFHVLHTDIKCDVTFTRTKLFNNVA